MVLSYVIPEQNPLDKLQSTEVARKLLDVSDAVCSGLMTFHISLLRQSLPTNIAFKFSLAVMPFFGTDMRNAVVSVDR